MTGDQQGTALPDDGDRGMEPRDAAKLLEQTVKQARRQFETSPPILWVVRAVVMLVGYGSIWLSVRAQHPYNGPTGGALTAV